MKRALVTGSSGFVGRHFVKHLRDNGWFVCEVDIAGRYPLDCRQFFEKRLGQTVFDLVVHCAALVGGRARIEGDPLSLAVNLEIDASMFRWAARAKPGRVVYFSSPAAYPTRMQERDRGGTFSHGYRLQEGDLEVDPSSRCFGVDFPDGTYGWAKVTGEYLAAHARRAGVPVTVIRPFSGYGTDQSLDYPFPSFIQRAKERQDPFVIWGSGEQVRDWVHIDDIVGLTMAAVGRKLDGPLNACTGIPTLFLELQDAVCKAVGYEPGVQLLLDKPVGVDYRVGDPAESLRIHTPRVGLTEGIQRALRGEL